MNVDQSLTGSGPQHMNTSTGKNPMTPLSTCMTSDTYRKININQVLDCHIIYLPTLTHHVQVSCLQTKDINLTHQDVFF